MSEEPTEESREPPRQISSWRFAGHAPAHQALYQLLIPATAILRVASAPPKGEGQDICESDWMPDCLSKG